jgi:hypothetical protein
VFVIKEVCIFHDDFLRFVHVCGLVLALVMFVCWDGRVSRGFVQLQFNVFRALMYTLCIEGKDNIKILSCQPFASESEVLRCLL